MWQKSSLLVLILCLLAIPLRAQNTNVAFGSLVAHINTIANIDEVFYIGTDQHVHEFWNSAGVWHAADLTAVAGGPNASLGSTIAAQINTIASTDEVFYIGTDRHVHQLWNSAGI